MAIVQALKALAQSARENGDAQILACIAECILACLASIIEYFNKWAFIVSHSLIPQKPGGFAHKNNVSATHYSFCLGVLLLRLLLYSLTRDP